MAYPENADILVKIKRIVLRGDFIFTEKAAVEMEQDGLTEEMVSESVMNAPAIFKKLRSKNPRTGTREKLYVIIGVTFDGLPIYTKGKIAKREGKEVFYVYISSKRSQAT